MHRRIKHIVCLILLCFLSFQGFPQANKLASRKSLSIPFPTAVAPGYSPQEEKYDVNFYFIDLEVTNKSTYISGASTLNARRISEAIDTFVVELSQKLTVDSVILNGINQAEFYREGDLVKIVLSNENKIAIDYSVKIFYNGLAGSGGFFSGISSSNAYKWNQDVTYTLSEPFQAKDWFPAKQNLRDKADSAWVFITVDSSLKVGSNGLLTAVKNLDGGKNRFEWKSNYTVAYYLLSFSAGDYVDYSFYSPINETDSVFVQNYLYDSPGIETVKPIIDETTPLLKLFSEDFGMFPFIKEKYGHCMAPMGGGMEHQTMTTIAGFDFGIVAHELAHSWFGDYLTCASWQDIWINEGFASYAEFIAIDALKSHADAVKWLSQAQNFAINYPFDGVFLTPEESRNVQRIFSSGLSYKKGGAIIHMLRYEINNDSLFFTIIRDYVKSFANSNATGQDFQNIVEKHTGEDFNWFFDQWYYGKGYPVFVTNWRQVGDSLILTSSQSSSTGNAEFFKTHMDYRIHYLSGKISDFRVFYENSDETFRIKVTEEVNSIQIDPESNVLKNAAVYKYTDLTKVFLVSPNPFKNELNIAFRNSTKPREIVLSGITGKVFLSQTVTAGSLTLDLSFLKQGIYLLQVTEDGIKYTEKVIRQ